MPRKRGTSRWSSSPPSAGREHERPYERPSIRSDITPPDDILGDGSLHRFHIEGDRPGTRNGWYVLHLDGIPAGSFGSWKTGDTYTWCWGRMRMVPGKDPAGRWQPGGVEAFARATSASIITRPCTCRVRSP